MLRTAPSAGNGDPQRRTPRAATRTDDGELMRRVRADDRVALGVLYDRHAASVYGLAYRMLRERSAAEDVVQETFIAVWRSRDGYRPQQGSLRAWLLTIARNRAIDAIRRGRADLHAELDTDREQEAPDRTDDEALRRIEAEDIGGVLRSLPDVQRQALELSYFSGLSQREIATRLGIPIGTVKGRMRLALQKLATQLPTPLPA